MKKNRSYNCNCFCSNCGHTLFNISFRYEHSETFDNFPIPKGAESFGGTYYKLLKCTFYIFLALFEDLILN